MTLSCMITWSDLINPFHVRRDTHLLGELWTLRQEHRFTEVVNLEDSRTGLCRGFLELG